MQTYKLNGKPYPIRSIHVGHERIRVAASTLLYALQEYPDDQECRVIEDSFALYFDDVSEMLDLPDYAVLALIEEHKLHGI